MLKRSRTVFLNWALLPKNKNQIFFQLFCETQYTNFNSAGLVWPSHYSSLYWQAVCGQQLWLCSVKPSVMTKSRGTRKWRTNAVAGAARPPAAAGIAEAGFCLLSMYTTAWQGMYYVQRIIDYHKRPHYIRPRGGSKPGRPSCQKNLYHERS